MRPLTKLNCEDALLAYEERQKAVTGSDPSAGPRMQMEIEIIRKAWQIVLCSLWEKKYFQEHPEAESRMSSSKPHARGQGTS